MINNMVEGIKNALTKTVGEGFDYYTSYRILYLIFLMVLSFLIEDRLVGACIVFLMLVESLAVNIRARRRYTPGDTPVVAIDIDDTILSEKSFPGVGAPYKHAIETINRMYESGYEVIMITSRAGDTLKYTIRGLQILGLNPAIRFNEQSNHYSNRRSEMGDKILASVYIDDKAYGLRVNGFKHEWPHIHRAFLGTNYDDYHAFKRFKKEYESDDRL